MSRFSLILVLCIMVFAWEPVQAQTSNRRPSNLWSNGVDFTKRAAAREKTRWSLSDWLEMKNRNQMMDMWLSMNSPSPYEFSLGLLYINNEVLHPVEDKNLPSYAGEFTAHAQFVGLTVEHENNSREGHSDLTGMFNLRLLGNSLQNTSLTLHYGQLTRELSGLTLKPQFAQATLQIYISKYFGLEGKYRHYLPFDDISVGEVTGTNTEAGIFIDFKALRIFGSWYDESFQNKIPAGIETDFSRRTGIKSGIKIFF